MELDAAHSTTPRGNVDADPSSLEATPASDAFDFGLALAGSSAEDLTGLRWQRDLCAHVDRSLRDLETWRKTRAEEMLATKAQLAASAEEQQAFAIASTCLAEEQANFRRRTQDGEPQSPPSSAGREVGDSLHALAAETIEASQSTVERVQQSVRDCAHASHRLASPPGTWTEALHGDGRAANGALQRLQVQHWLAQAAEAAREGEHAHKEAELCREGGQLGMELGSLASELAGYTSELDRLLAQLDDLG